MKTQTRRVVKWPANGRDSTYAKRPPTDHEAVAEYGRGGLFPLERGFFGARCPYGGPGDFLWVRETWAPDPLERHQAVYFASQAGPDMPRWASRILLRVEAVRVERLHGISIADAQAEGVEAVGENGPGPFRRWRNYQREGEWYSSPRASFASLWASINGAELWGANPWVWVITFARVDVIPEGAKARPILFSAPMVRAILSP